MEELIDAMKNEIKEKFAHYSSKKMLNQIFHIVLNQISTLKINCPICSSQIEFLQYTKHLIEHCNPPVFEPELLMLAQCYHNGTYTNKDREKAIEYYNQILSINTNNSIADENIKLISIYSI